MSAAAQPVQDAQQRAVRAIDLVVGCVQERFTGSVELHFQDGVPKSAKKIMTLHLEPSSPDLLRQR